MFDPLFYQAAAAKFAGVPTAAAPRPEVPGMKVPRIHTPRMMPQDLGRGKGTIPTNPFSGNWQQKAAGGGGVDVTDVLRGAGISADMPAPEQHARLMRAAARDSAQNYVQARIRPYRPIASAFAGATLGGIAGGYLGDLAKGKPGMLPGLLGGGALGAAAGHLLNRQHSGGPHVAERAHVLALVANHPEVRNAVLRAYLGPSPTSDPTLTDKAADVPSFPEQAGRAIGGFIGKRPVLSTALLYGAYRSPDILRAARNRISDRQPAAGYGTVHAARGLASPSY